MSKSQFIWEAAADLLAFAQFPWRYLGISIILMALVGAAGVAWFPKRWQTAIIVALWLVLVGTSASYFQGESYTGEDVHYTDEPEYIRQTLSGVLVDYLPIDFANEWQEVPMAQMVHEGNQPAVLVERMHEKLVQFEREASGEAEFNIAYYPGWRAEIDGEPAEIRVSERGNIVIDVPAGRHKVGVQLDSTPLRRVCNWVSAISWLALAAWVLTGEKLGYNNAKRRD